LFDSFGEAAKDFFGGSDPVNLDHTASFAIKVDEWLGLGLIKVKSAIDGIGGVVVTLNHVSHAVIAAPLAGLVASCLIVGATVTAHTADGQPSKDQFTGNYKINGKVKRATRSCLVE
jgi:hypothetical protein